MTTRAEVYEAIDGEREYQERQWATLDTTNSVKDFVGYMKTYIEHAEGAIPSDDRQRVLHMVRKVAGLTVACMERHGAPKR